MRSRGHFLASTYISQALEGRPPSEPVAAPIPSNVVPFPVRMNRPDRPVLEDLRVVGTA